MKMKRILITLLAAVMCLQGFSLSAFASTGDPNMGGGSQGGWGNTQDGSSWNSGEDGVRVTVVDSQTGEIKSASIDYTNINASRVERHFGKVCKTDYAKNGRTLVFGYDKYEYINPAISLPKIIEGSIQNVRDYFTDKTALQNIAQDTGLSYDDLICGDYKLLIEPIAYFTFNGIYVAATATEAAMFNTMLGGNKLRAPLRPLTHLNLPYAIYLEKDDLGYKAKDVQRAFNGDGKPYYMDRDIIDYLGIGIVSFKETPSEPIEADIEYNADTTVYTTIPFYNSTIRAYIGDLGNTDNIRFTESYRDGGWGEGYWSEYDWYYHEYYAVGAKVRFQVIDSSGRTIVNQTVSLECPAYRETPAYICWKTPKKEQAVTIKITTDDGLLVYKGQRSNTVQFRAKITKVKDVPPPDPKADDPAPKMTYLTPSKVLKDVGDYAENNKTSLSWSEWKCDYYYRWVEYSDSEKVYIRGFDHNTYRVSISAKAEITPAKECKTATSNGSGDYTMKSGYGFEIKVTNRLSGNGTFACTGVQHCNTLFPEFDYKTYNRLLEKEGNSFVFKRNEYSTYDSRVHFTPIRFPDNTNYNVYAEVFDVWCPAGSLSQKLTDNIYIKGNVYDDWHVAPVKP